MIKLVKTNATDPDFVSLIKELDAFLAITDGEDHSFYNQYNSLDTIKYVVLAYKDAIPVACGAIKEFDKSTMEVKRMFTRQNQRGMGIASEILRALENWAVSLGYSACILETGVRQVEAISLYIKCGYSQIENYGQYAEVADSLCFRKELNK